MSAIRKGTPATAAKNRYNAKAYKQLPFMVKRDGADGFTADTLATAAMLSGMSKNAFIVAAIRDKIQQDFPNGVPMDHEQ